MGPRTDPWGTQLTAALVPDVEPFTDTENVLSSRKDLIQASKDECNPYVANLRSNNL